MHFQVLESLRTRIVKDHTRCEHFALALKPTAIDLSEFDCRGRCRGSLGMSSESAIIVETDRQMGEDKPSW